MLRLLSLQYAYWYLTRVWVLFQSLSSIKFDKTSLLKILNVLFKKKSEVLVFNYNRSFWVRDVYDLVSIEETFGDEVYRRLFHGLKLNTTFIDIGAYNGDSTIYGADNRFIKKTIAIEPLPENYNFLTKNVTLNNIGNVELINAAVSNHNKGTMLYIYPNRRQSGIANSHSSRKKIFVKTITLRKLLQRVETKYCVLKCDAEGAEYEIFLKTPKFVMKKVDRIAIEFHKTNSSNISKPKLQVYLTKCGFKLEVVENNKFEDFGYIYAEKVGKNISRV